MRVRLYKFKVPDTSFPGLLTENLRMIRELLGHVEIVKIKRCFWESSSMYIWVRKIKGDPNV